MFSLPENIAELKRIEFSLLNVNLHTLYAESDSLLLSFMLGIEH